MPRPIDRRKFLKTTSAAAAGIALTPAGLSRGAAAQADAVRIGCIGTGGRGRSLLETMLTIPGVQVPAVCDLDPKAAQLAQEVAAKAGRDKPEAYAGAPDSYKKLLARDDLHAAIIATPWDLHAPMAADAMKAGKYAGVEVPCALTLEECWDLVNVHESTGVPCMMLENWSFRRDNLAVLQMIRQGLLGEIVHCHCAHSHDCLDHWFFDAEGKRRWGGEFLLRRNADQYPTHSLGPVLSWMDIPCGDTYDYLTSTATDPVGVYAYFRRKFGPDHPALQEKFRQGDIVTTVIRTKKGKTIVVNYDMQLPRPYDNRWLIQGTLGLYDEERSSVYLLGKSPKYHEWEPFAPYQEKHEHPWWKGLKERAAKAGHEGTDLLELEKFVQAVRGKSRTPLDVYESVLMSAIIPLSEKSIASGSAPVQCPDFTRGKWAAWKPSFAVESAP